MGSAYIARSLAEVLSKPSGEGSTPSNRFCKGLSEKKNALQEVQCSVLVYSYTVIMPKEEYY